MAPIRVPVVSVVIPTYNRAELLPTTIASVTLQSLVDVEVLVVDDGSPDATAISGTSAIQSTPYGSAI